jgi:predicted sulfurtransferase
VALNITSRGRVTQEGLNCTLTGRPEDIRSFCYGLREWKDIFNETDFKVTNGVPMGKLFKSLSIRKADELVAYGLAGGKLHYHVFVFDVFKDYDNRDEETRAAVQNH